jgi:hypothetical protein
MKRTTQKDLQNIVDNINELLTDKVQLSGAYGGWQLERVKSHNNVLSCGFISKPNLYALLRAYYCGLLECN